MKENLFDVLMYLFDNYFEEDFEINPDQEELKQELVQAGFSESQISKAFDWLEGLAIQKDLIQSDTQSDDKSIRVFNDYESEKLNIDCRGFILFLEQVGVLDVHDREMVIDRVMALDADEIDLQQLKWVVLMVLLNQPGKEAAFSWMEDIVMDDSNMGLH